MDPKGPRTHNARDEGPRANDRVISPLSGKMHTTIQLLGFWALAFVTLGIALVLLNIFDGLVGNDLILHSTGKEALIAGVASLIEGGCVWVVISFLPLAARALIVPFLIVALIYKIGHLEDWSRYDVFMLLVFQAVITGIAVALVVGQFQTAFAILIVFALALALLAGFARDL